jgi:hypothetical protein
MNNIATQSEGGESKNIYDDALNLASLRLCG